MVILLNLVLAGLKLGLKNYQVGEKRIPDDYLYLCKGFRIRIKPRLFGLFL
ncbi:hypothetical protein THERMOT_1500 [Bathymodiolus thermophilus thioautotrophic gill symbiont]|uniref:Uncharacterized protein n=1 Tax=Bathymodiolus thermophilus thioautotrophic gill symbiont TaxID=2360 RepID=A0A8H8XDX4_9GAMM|nr:hypothetical protein THERMOT_1500 [Bathymodiolus thermophilus thioautotrophic gill symbiont]CAB5506282.1 hypothetical protein THERMOS_2270 [Bathymodiolus thermophilus thioautotrophic gill symbiont]